MKTEHLIRTLVAETRPVRRLQAPSTRCLGWIGFTLLFVAGGVVCLGARVDLAHKGRDLGFLSENAALAVAFLLAARSAFELGVPDDERSRWTFLSPLVGLGFWLALVLARAWPALSASGIALEVRPGFACVLRVLGLGSLPVVLCWQQLLAGAPLEKRWTGWCLSLSAFSMAMIGTQLLCPTDEPLHVLFWHTAPLVLLAYLGWCWGTLLFERRTE